MEGYYELDGEPLQKGLRPFLMNALWFGLPQARERVYIVGVKVSGDSLGVNQANFLDRVQTYLRQMYQTPPQAEPWVHVT